MDPQILAPRTFFSAFHFSLFTIFFLSRTIPLPPRRAALGFHAQKILIEQTETRGLAMSKIDKQPLPLSSDESAPADSSADNLAAETDELEKLRGLVANYEARLDELAELISRVRHEINNPLTGVLGQAQLLLREDLTEGVRKRTETIEQLAIRIRDIVAELRQIQKPSRG